jgi:hypothetical protein
LFHNSIFVENLSQGISSAVPVYHVVFEKSKSLENCLALKGWKPFALSQPQPSGLESLSSRLYALVLIVL